MNNEHPCKYCGLWTSGLSDEGCSEKPTNAKLAEAEAELKHCNAVVNRALEKCNKLEAELKQARAEVQQANRAQGHAIEILATVKALIEAGQADKLEKLICWHKDADYCEDVLAGRQCALKP